MEMESPGVDAAYRLVDALAVGLSLLMREGPRLLVFDEFHLATGRELQLMGILSRRMVARVPAACDHGSPRGPDHPALERFLTEDPGDPSSPAWSL